MVYLQEDSSSTESYSEGSGSEEEALTGDEVSEDGDYDDEEDDIDIEIEDDYDAESDFHSETDDGDEENDFDLEEEDDPECNLSGSSGERSCKGSGADNRKVCAYSFHKKQPQEIIIIKKNQQNLFLSWRKCLMLMMAGDI